MKKLLIILMLFIFGFANVYSQTDTTKTQAEIFDEKVKSELEQMKKDIRWDERSDSLVIMYDEVSGLIKQDYEKLGFENFTRKYKYVIIILFVILFMVILGAGTKLKN